MALRCRERAPSTTSTTVIAAKKKPPAGSSIQTLMVVDQAAINAGFGFRR
jgi:hypothetical protein